MADHRSLLEATAIGDVYGAQFEGRDAGEIARHNDGAHVHLRGGAREARYTDDTQLSLAIAEVLEAGLLTREAFAEAIVRAFRRDVRPGYARGFGQLLLEVRDGAELLARVRPGSERCGAAMRAAPIGLLADETQVRNVAKLQASVTHDTPGGIASAVAVALASHALRTGRVDRALLPAWLDRAMPRPDGRAWSELPPGPVPNHGVAVVCVVLEALGRARSLRELLVRSVERGGEVGSVAAIALALGSQDEALVDDLPPPLRACLEDGAFGRQHLLAFEARLRSRLQAGVPGAPVAVVPPPAPFVPTLSVGVSAVCDAPLGRLEVLLERQRRAPEDRAPIRGIVRFVPAPRVGPRAPVALALALDVSGSMQGGKLDRVKRAAKTLLSLLGPDDSFALVAFQEQARRISALQRVTPESRASAERELEALTADGTTAMYDGLAAALGELPHGAGEASVRRALLFTDGHANVGPQVHTFAPWRALLEGAAARRVGASFFGFGEDADGAFLERLSRLTGGNYQLVASEEAIGAAWGRETASLFGVLARDAVVKLRGPGVRELGDRPSRQEGDAIVVPLFELIEGERPTIAFELDGSAAPEGVVLEVQLCASGLDGRAHELRVVATQARGEPSEIDAAVAEEVLLGRGAVALVQAARAAEEGRFPEARALLLALAVEARAHGGPRAPGLAAALDEAARDHGDVRRHQQTRSQWSGTRSSIAKQRSSGSRLDAWYSTEREREMHRHFEPDEELP